jgi:hypothetical protein
MSTAIRLALRALEQELEALPPHGVKATRLRELINELKEMFS